MDDKVKADLTHLKTSLKRVFPQVSDDFIEAIFAGKSSIKVNDLHKSVQEITEMVLTESTRLVSSAGPLPISSRPSDDGRIIIARMDGYQEYHLTARASSRSEVNSECPVERHVRLVESQFFRATFSSWHRKLLKSVSYVENTRLTRLFEAKKAELRRKGVSDRELLLFHGTQDYNLDNILRENLDPARSKRAVFGKGVYFSSDPWDCKNFGNVIVACKVLPGNVQSFEINDRTFRPDKGFHSLVCNVTLDEGGQFYVLADNHHILPYCVVRLDEKRSRHDDVIAAAAARVPQRSTQPTGGSFSMPGVLESILAQSLPQSSSASGAQTVPSLPQPLPGFIVFDPMAAAANAAAGMTPVNSLQVVPISNNPRRPAPPSNPTPATPNWWAQSAPPQNSLYMGPPRNNPGADSGWYSTSNPTAAVSNMQRAITVAAITRSRAMSGLSQQQQSGPSNNATAPQNSFQVVPGNAPLADLGWPAPPPIPTPPTLPSNGSQATITVNGTAIPLLNATMPTLHRPMPPSTSTSNNPPTTARRSTSNDSNKCTICDSNISLSPLQTVNVTGNICFGCKILLNVVTDHGVEPSMLDCVKGDFTCKDLNECKACLCGKANRIGEFSINRVRSRSRGKLFELRLKYYQAKGFDTNTDEFFRSN